MKYANSWKYLKRDSQNKWSRVKLWVIHSPLAAFFAILFGLVVLATLISVIFGFNSAFIKNLGFNQKLWEWMDLLIVPVVLALAAYYLNRQQRESERRNSEKREKENLYRDSERESQEVFRIFLDTTEKLLIEYHEDVFDEEHPARKLVQARAKHALSILTKKWRDQFYQFLLDFGLSTGSIDGDTVSIGIFKGSELHSINLANANLTRADLREIDLRDSKLIRGDLSYALMTDSRLDRTTFIHTRFVGTIFQAEMGASKFYKCDMRHADFRESNLTEARFFKSDLFGSDMRGTVFEQAVLRDVRLQSTKLHDTQFVGTCLIRVNLRLADMIGANLRECQLKDVDLTGTDLRNAILHETIIDDVTLQTMHNKWQLVWEILNHPPQKERQLSGENFEEANLENVYLEEANLVGCDFGGANLRNANLRRAKIYGANLSNATLAGASLQQADLRMVDWRNTDLNPDQLPSKDRRIWEIVNQKLLIEGQMTEFLGLSSLQPEIGKVTRGREDYDLSEANLKGADLRNAILVEADLHNSDLTKAMLDNADLSHANLSGAKITDEQLERIRSLEGAIMPNGLKYLRD